MSSLRVTAPRTFADENAVQHDRVATKQSGATTRRGLGAAAQLNKPSTPSLSTASQPTKPAKLSTTTSAATTRRALGDITNSKKPTTATTATTHSKLQPPTKIVNVTTATTTATSLTQPHSPPPIERPLGRTWRQQEEWAMAELTTRRDSLTGLTPAQLASSIHQLLDNTEQRPYTSGDERVMRGWENESDEWCGGGSVSGGSDCGGVDERKVQALLELDLDIDLHL